MPKPKRLFHLTRPANEQSIREKGLLTSAFGESYFCTSVEDCVNIIGGRIAMAWDGTVKEVEVPARENENTPVNVRVDEEGRWWADVPNMEQNTHALLIEVDVDKLHAGSLHQSDDHNPMFFDVDSWAYYRDIPPHALTDIRLIPLWGDENE